MIRRDLFRTLVLAPLAALWAKSGFARDTTGAMRLSAPPELPPLGIDPERYPWVVRDRASIDHVRRAFFAAGHREAQNVGAIADDVYCSALHVRLHAVQRALTEDATLGVRNMTVHRPHAWDNAVRFNVLFQTRHSGADILAVSFWIQGGTCVEIGS